MNIVTYTLLCNCVFFMLSINSVVKGIQYSASLEGFSEIIKNPFFVDKTLLIKEVFCELFSQSTLKPPPVVKVLAPPKFGKSTNINMIKTFLEIAVDESGEPQEVKSTPNYKLFHQNSLSILRDGIFEKHLGKYPVIYINCSPLREATNFNDTVDKFREILKATFSEHSYLLSAGNLWKDQFNKSSFQVYFDSDNYSRLHQYYIFCGFSILSRVLKVHFGRPVFVLVDDFDAVEDCPAYVTGEDKRRIYNYNKEVQDDLLLDNENVVGALLVGTLREVKKEKKKKKEKKVKRQKAVNIVESSSTLWEYFGLSEKEMKSLLRRFMNENELEVAANTILTKYSGISKDFKSSQKHQPCSVWSIEQYFAPERNNNLTGFS